MDLFVRLSFSYSMLQSFFKSFEDNCVSLLVYEHNTDSTNVHVHFYATAVSIKTDAIKKRISKFLGFKPSATQWSFKTATDDGCIVYMSKGCIDPSHVKGFTQDSLVSYKDRWVERTPETSAPKKSGPTQYDMSMEVYDMVVSKYSKGALDSIFSSDDIVSQQSDFELYELCIKYAIKVCHKYRKGFDEYSIRKIITPAYTKFQKGKSSFVSKVSSNYFR